MSLCIVETFVILGFDLIRQHVTIERTVTCRPYTCKCILEIIPTALSIRALKQSQSHFDRVETVVGPMMILELCDTTLKDWLNEKSALSVTMLDDILLFTLNIASGVEFLHSKHVTFYNYSLSYLQLRTC